MSSGAMVVPAQQGVAVRDAAGPARTSRELAGTALFLATDEELKEWVRTHLRSTKTPEVIQVRDAMPYNETGKLLRRVIKADLSGGPAK